MRRRDVHTAVLVLSVGLAHCDVSHTVEAGDDVIDATVRDVPTAIDAQIDTGQDITIDVPTDVVRDVPNDALSQGSCNFMSRSLCEDFVSVHAQPYINSCMSMGGTWSSDSCVHAGAIGGCQHAGTDGSHTILWIYTPDADVTMTQMQCFAGGGMWVSP